MNEPGYAITRWMIMLARLDQSARALGDPSAALLVATAFLGPERPSKDAVYVEFASVIPFGDQVRFLECAGRAVAALHGVHGKRFGWHRDGWLDRLPQRNGWNIDGHGFFAERRLLRYLHEPNVVRVLNASERATVDGFAPVCPSWSR
jgi:hypothetical protein